MKILILHRIPYHKILYERGIDHSAHEVVYFGTEQALATLPPHLPCRRAARPGRERAALEAAQAFEKAHDFDCVISLSEYELLDAAELRERWGIKGPDVTDVLKVRDKVLMKEAVACRGIRVPLNLRLKEALTSPTSIPWRGRTVLKPVDGASSEGVQIFEDLRSALQAVRAQAEFDLSRYEIEEFIEGPILHIDGLVQSSKVLIQIPSRYIGTCLGYAQGQPLGSVQIEPSKEVEEWTQACIRAVGIENGCFHLEAIQSPKGLVFLEIGARVGGADVVDSFELKTNMHLPSSELKILLEPERPVLLRLQISSNYFGWFVYPGHHLAAEYAQVRGTESFKAHASVFRWDELTPTQKLPRKITYQAVEVPVAGVVQGPSSSYLECFVQHIFEEVLLEPLEMPRQTQSASGV